MAPLNPDSTDRLYVQYTSVNIQHELLFRFPPNSPPTDAATVARVACTEMANVMREDDNFVAARYGVAGNDFTFPVPWAVIPGTVANTLVAGDPESRFLSFVGRDALVGRRVRYDLYTGASIIPIPSINRIPEGSNALLDAILSALDSIANPTLDDLGIITIGGAPPIFNRYVNSAFAAYWQRKQRRTG